MNHELYLILVTAMVEQVVPMGAHVSTRWQQRERDLVFSPYNSTRSANHDLGFDQRLLAHQRQEVGARDLQDPEH